MLVQSSAFSLPVASIHSTTASNSKSVCDHGDGWVGDDLRSLLEQESAAVAALVGVLSETLATEESAASGGVVSLGVAHHRIDDGIATHEALEGVENRLAVLER